MYPNRKKHCRIKFTEKNESILMMKQHNCSQLFYVHNEIILHNMGGQMSHVTFNQSFLFI